MIAPTPFFADRGCHTRIYGQVVSLQKRGHEVILCTYGLGKDIEGVTTKRCFNFPWYKKLSAGPSITKILTMPFLYGTSLKQIRRFKPDIVHVFLHEGVFIGRFCQIFYRKPLYIHDMQGSLSIEVKDHGFVKKGGFLAHLLLGLERRMNGWFPITTLSDLLEKQAIEFGANPDKIVNVLDGVDIDLFLPIPPDEELTKRYEIDLSQPRLLFMGLLETYQGVDVLLEAFAMVLQKHPSAQLIIIGYPNIERYKAKCSDLGVEEKVVFMGKVPFLEVPRYLSLAEIAVSPKISETEGSGKTYNYMAMGMATVASDRPVSHEIFGDDPNFVCGLIGGLNEAKPLAEQICTLIENPALRKQIGMNARRRAVESLSYDIGAEKIEAFYYRMQKEV